MSWARISSAFLAAALSSACVTAGAKPYRDAERFRTEGKLADARRAYKDAIQTEPENKSYQARLDSLEEQIGLEIERLKGEAKEKEKASDWAGASAIYAQGLELRPGDEDLAARRALTAAKAKNLDPEAWFAELERLSGELKGNKVVERSLAGARAGAYQYHVALAGQLIDAGDGPGALGHFERARQIDPSTPGWKAEPYDKARALDMVAQADLRIMAGDSVEAHDLLSKAAELWSSPEIKKKLAEAKGRASAIVKKLESARGLAEKKRWAEALRAYEELGGMKGVPASVSGEAAKVRSELARTSAVEAESIAKKGDLKRAKSSLAEALRAAELPPGPVEGLKLGVDLALSGQPGKGKSTLDAAGIPDPAILAAAQAIVAGAASSELTRARSISKKDAPGALAILAELEPFADSMPEIAALKQALRKDAFQGLLDDALAKAKAGKDREAGELLLAALRASKAPANVAGPVEEGAKAISASSLADAERAFQAALAAAPKSVLAQRGLDIARLRMSVGEKDALEAIRAGKGELGAAVLGLERARTAQPGNASAAEAAKIMLGRLGKEGGALDDLTLARDLGYAARLSELPQSARAALEAGSGALAQGDYATAEERFKQAETAAPDAPIAALARQLSKSRMMASLKAGAKNVADEAGATALRKLLAADPKNAEALAAIDGLHAQAKKAATAGDLAGASRALALAVVATEPAPGVKSALEKANAALAAGDLAGAESAYGDATDLEAGNATGKTGLQIAKDARVAGLKAAVAEAKSGASTDAAAAALQKTLEVDPNSAEAREAFKELLATATARGAEGKDREAAKLLDAANTASKPETAKKAIAAANALLADGKHAEAEAAYAKLLEGAESKVARTGKEIARARRVATLLAGVAELKSGAELERGARATRQLLTLDGTNAEALAAIEAAMKRAEAAADAGDEKAAAAELRAADTAGGPTDGLPKALSELERGRYDEAIESFGKLSGPIAARGAAIAKQRKVAGLKASMSGDDSKKADAIKAMLAQNPTDKDAQAEIAKLLERARTSAKKGDDADAAKALQIATKATGAPDELAGPLDIASGHLSEGRYAEAEQSYATALEINKASKVAETGLAVARERRKGAEKAAMDAIKKGEDPLKPAQVLQATLIVEPKSKAVTDAFTQLLARAKASAAKGNVVDTARTLDAAAMLEGLPAAMVQKITEADVALAASKFAEAEAAYAAALAGAEGEAPRPSQVAQIGRTLARDRRLAELRAELAAAQKDKDLMRSSAAVKEILALDPNDKQAKALAPKLGGDVAEDRYQAAMTQKGFGKHGVAHLYLSRALAADPGHAKAKEELLALEKTLGESLDLVVRVSELHREKSVSGCADFEGAIRAELMRVASEKTSLGLYVLGPSWTEKVDKNAPDAPKVGGALDVVLASCTSNPATAKAKLSWKLLVPGRDGKTLAEGSVDAEVPAGLVPRDEQDPAQQNVRIAMGKRATAALVAGLEGARAKIDEHLLVLAEHAVAAKDPALAADAVAKLRLAKLRADEARLSEVQKYLDAELK